MTQPQLEAFVGRDIAGYRILEVLGAGAMGAVFRADASSRGWPTVALKVLSPHLTHEPRLRERFVREGLAQQRLAHPNVLRVFDAGDADGTAYIAMEFTARGSLGDYLRKRRQLPEADVRRLFHEILAGLWHAHSAGYVHRDIKPDNVLLRGDGSAALADFGIVGELGQEESNQLTQTGALLGTPAFMSPEACRGETVDQRSDLYSVGCMMFQALTGQLLFRDHAGVRMLMAHAAVPATPPSQRAPVSADLDAIVLRLLEKQAKDRFPTAEEVLRVLEGGYLTDPINGARNRKQYESALARAGSTAPGAVAGGTIESTSVDTPLVMATLATTTRVDRPTRRREPRASGVAEPRPKGWLAPASLVLAVSGITAAVVAGLFWQSAEQKLRNASEQLAATRSQLQAASATADQGSRDATALRDELQDAMRRVADYEGGMEQASITLAQQVVDNWNRYGPGRNRRWCTADQAAAIGRTLRMVEDRAPRLSVVRCQAIGITELIVTDPDCSEALVRLDRAVAENPDDVLLRLVRGHVRSRNRQPEEAIRDYDAVIAASGDYRAYQGRAGVLISRGDWEGGLDAFARAIAAHPGDAHLMAVRAYKRVEWMQATAGEGPLKTDQFELAGRELDEAVAADPSEAQAWLFRAIWYQQKRDFDTALDNYEQANRLAPDLATGWYHRAMCLYHMRRLDDAIDSMSRAIACQADYYHAYANRAMFRMEAEDFEGAARDFRTALTFDFAPAERWILLTQLARSLARTGDRERALDTIERALEACPPAERAKVEQIRREIAER